MLHNPKVVHLRVFSNDISEQESQRMEGRRKLRFDRNSTDQVCRMEKHVIRGALT